MRRMILSLAVICVVGVAAHAQDSPIEQVIADQLAAFQADDFDTAYSFASPTIKRLFGSPERFGQMVRDGYPMVYRPADVTMLEQRVIGGQTVQRVMMRDAAGRLHFLAYQMIETPEGWQINGVQILRAPELGA